VAAVAVDDGLGGAVLVQVDHGDVDLAVTVGVELEQVGLAVAVGVGGPEVRLAVLLVSPTMMSWRSSPRVSTISPSLMAFLSWLSCRCRSSP